MMMNKWAKIEEKINYLINAILAFIKLVMSKIIPPQVKSFFTKIKALGKTVNLFFVAKFAQLKEAFKSTLVKIKAFLISIIGKFQSVFQKLNTKARSVNIKELGPKQLTVLTLAAAVPLLLKIKQWYISLKPITIVGFVVTSAVGTLTVVSVYTSGKNLVEKATHQEERSIASVAPKKEDRPKYYKLDEKTLRIINLIFPVFLDNQATTPRYLNITIDVISSNQYIGQYFMKNPERIQDIINTHIEPIDSKFMMTDEGKEVIKEKIKSELTKLLEIKGIKGEIEEIAIVSILSA